MGNSIVLSLTKNKNLVNTIAAYLPIEIGSLETHEFPDGEIYVRINADVKNKIVILICELDHPNNAILLLMFVAKKIKELGAKKFV